MKKDLTSDQYWTMFGDGLPVEKPGLREAADYVLSLHSEIRQLKEDADQARKQEKIAIQLFETFAMEAQNNLSALVRKYQPLK